MHGDTDEQAAQRGAAIVRAAAAQVSAPQSLREEIERARTARTRPAAGTRRRFTLAGGGVLAAAVVVLVLLVTGGSPRPTVAQAAAIAADRPSETGVPARDPSKPGLIEVRESGVQFPYWADRFPKWKPEGVRTDTLKGRHATTVYYATPTNITLGYTVVSGKALKVPNGVAAVSHGERYVQIELAGRNAVTWERDGHTCVISASPLVPKERLLALAQWSGTAEGS